MRRHRARALLGLGVLALVTALGSPGRAGARAIRAELANGVVVLVRENPVAPVVAVSLLVKVGERWEREDTAGISNFLHQVMVKGTTTRSAVDLAEEAERVGGRLEASGDTDFSEIRARGLARRWRPLLDLVADVALHPALAEAEIEKERRVILMGIRNRADQPFPRAFDSLKALLYAGHPYGMPSLGRADVVERLTREALVAHHRRYYRARRLIVSVSGEVPAPEVIAEARRLFSSVPAGEEGLDEDRPIVAAPPTRVAVAHPAAQAQVLAGFVTPPIGHPDYAAVKVLSTALGGGMAGRLFTELRDKQGLAYSTGALYPSRVGPSVLVAYMGTAPANAERAEAGLRGEIERVRRDGIRPEELERAKAYLLGQFALDRRTNARLAWYQAFFESAGVGHDFDERYVRAVEAVTSEDLVRVARLYLGAPTVVNLGPAPR